MKIVNRTVVIVTPGQRFLEWLHRVDSSNAELSLEDLKEEPTAYLLPEYMGEQGLQTALKLCCKQIFEEELDAWWTESDDWPKPRTWKTFEVWFEWTVHSIVIDLGREPLTAINDEA